MKLKLHLCIIAFFSSALQAFGIYNIHALSGVTEGGVLGVVLSGQIIGAIQRLKQ